MARVEPDSGITVDGGLVKVGHSTLRNVHTPQACGPVCWVHRPTDHPMRTWPANWRQNGKLLERVCECGNLHPDPDDLEARRLRGDRHEFEHHCCGCCNAPPAYPEVDSEEAVNELTAMARALLEGL